MPKKAAILSFIQQPAFVFVVVLAAFFIHYNYANILPLRPQGTHQWRQTDCTSLALNYYQDGNAFFEPTVHNQLGGTGKAVGEFPIIYYIIAQFYHLFGPHELIFRAFNLFLFFLGLFALFKLSHDFLEDRTWSIFSTFLIFTAPIIVFYVNNFLPDAPALGLVFLGWYFFFRFYRDQKQLWFLIAMAFFMIAGLIKVTAAMSFVVMGAIYVFEVLGIMKFKKEGRVYEKPLLQLVPFALVLISIVSWYLYALHYNELNETGYFSTQTRPIYILTETHIAQIIAMIKMKWRYQYFDQFTLLFLGLALVGNILLWKRVHPIFKLAIPLFICGIAVYGLLWFQAFDHHDYYLINLYVLPAILLISLFSAIKKSYPGLFGSWGLKMVFILFLIYNISYASSELKRRYNPEVTKTYNANYFTLASYLDSIGIDRSKRVINTFDASPNISLYLMNRDGWTNINNLTDSTKVHRIITLGADYIIVGDTVEQKMPHLNPFLTEKVGDYRGIEIFKVPDWARPAN